MVGGAELGSHGFPILRALRRVGNELDSSTALGSIRPPPLLRKNGAPALRQRSSDGLRFCGWEGEPPGEPWLS
jgi:hypothetical protein